jgi:hypothetical protein
MFLSIFYHFGVGILSRLGRGRFSSATMIQVTDAMIMLPKPPLV